MDRQKWINYDGFVEKFKPKLTTDDCYTPENVYDTIENWCIEEYGIDKSKVVRPFYPGGDYKNYDYGDNKIVIDNPPFSILAQIVKFYIDTGVEFFLFAPALTLFSPMTSARCCYLCVSVDITYENGAKVPTSFITNLESPGVRSAPELYERLEEIDRIKNSKVSLPKYKYPDEVLTATKVNYLSKNGVHFKADINELLKIQGLDCQRAYNKKIFGYGFLMSRRKAAELKAKEQSIKANVFYWNLSEREQEIIEKL